MEKIIFSRWPEYSAGKISQTEYWTHVRNKLGITRKQTRMIRDELFANTKPQKGMMMLVRKLKKNYRVVVLSGNIRERIRYLNKKYNIKNEFHDHHYSFHYGYDKPDIRLFRCAINKMGVKPKDCIVVDDDRRFIVRVKKDGARGVLFRNARQAEAELKKMGVKI